MTAFDHIKSFFQLPFPVLVIVPALLQYNTNDPAIIPMDIIPNPISYLLGGFFLFLGLKLFIRSLGLFISKGKGTLAPWNPTRNLVISGVYRYVRNPMLIGVNAILLSESFFFKSGSILLWALFFICLNHLYFIFKEEPDTEKRFGQAYLDYKNNAPRWIPRFTPWEQK